MQAHHYKLAGLLVLSVVAITVAFLLPPIAQDPAYQVFFIGILLTGFLSGHSIKHIIAAGGRCSFTWPCVTGIRLSISPCEAGNMYCSKRSRE
jgi:hypothetical protein